MRIGLLAPPWLPVPPPGYGGTESVVDRLARGLVAAGAEVVLAAPADSTCPVPRVGDRPSEPDRMGCAAVELAHVLRSYAALTDSALTDSALTPVDLIHDHTLAGPLFGRALIPRVATQHGPFDDDLTEIYRKVPADVALVAVSQHQASTARGIPISRVIRHGLDVDAIPVGRGGGGYACYLGRMTADKGVREAALIARAAGLPLRIAAKMREEPERQYFEDRVRPLLSRDVTYVGELGIAEKYELLGGAVALVNPIRWPEPFGLVMIEALACGTPVVASRCGSVPEIVCDGVTGFIRSGVGALADALQRVTDLDRRSCRLAAVSQFSADRMVAEHLELYADLLAGRPRPLRRCVGTALGAPV